MITFDFWRDFQSHLLFLLAMATSSRFADLSRQEIAGLVKEKDSKNTQLATKTAFSTFCGEKYPEKDQNFDEISKEELNELLVDFCSNARGKKTEKTTIRQH